MCRERPLHNICFARTVRSVASDEGKGDEAWLNCLIQYEVTLDDFRNRIARTKQFLGTLEANSFATSLGSGVANPLAGDPRTYKAFDYVRDVAIPNFYIHLTTLYAILRQSGVPLGKCDFEGPIAVHDAVL